MNTTDKRAQAAEPVASDNTRHALNLHNHIDLVLSARTLDEAKLHARKLFALAASADAEAAAYGLNAGRNTHPAPVASASADSGRIWSFLRNVIEQGRAIQQDSTAGKFESYELLSARIDEAARERADEFEKRFATHPAPVTADEPNYLHQRDLLLIALRRIRSLAPKNVHKSYEIADQAINGIARIGECVGGDGCDG